MNNGLPSTASAHVPPHPRPIRFVTNHDGPYAKRRRINSACLTCRRKKTRCSGERPVCGTCLTNKHSCEGYGDDNSNSSESTKDGKKAARWAGTTNSNATSAKKEVASQTSQPPRPRSSSSSLRNQPSSESSPAVRGHKQHGDNSILTLSTRNRMPYFRYFGPTAIMPGFKQMVVKVRGNQHGTGHTTSDPIISSPALPPSVGSIPSEAQSPIDIPLYDTSAMSPSPLITHLCNLFFVHLGCNFPFLQRDRFLRDLEEKQVDAILVDAVCALAARFSTHQVFTGDPENLKHPSRKLQPPDYGQAFAQRAKSAIPDTFPCPSVAAVQAALLLAYDEFGASRDSGLWMYLGIAIRMAQDLGMHTREGLKYEGRDGTTPKSVKTDPVAEPNTLPKRPEVRRKPSTSAAEEEQRAVEQERLDTFWVIFLLDRIISSGTGRPVTLRDRDIEICFPSLEDFDSESGSQLPFPALIRIVHLYGRVTDLLNSIKDNADRTEAKALQKQLGTLEFHLTDIYQNLSPKLHFNALNFQHYVKLNQGTNFLLLHCWFHTLIVLLHQPTLLKTFESSTHTLSNHSRELSMSSAKTVADILAFTDLIDPKTGLGSPFTSQPIYIAACAFLKETALHSVSSRTHSRSTSPGAAQDYRSATGGVMSLDHMTFTAPIAERSRMSEQVHKLAAKHTLLATAANQNYQRCYRALKSLEKYWSGVKYIVTVLEQKAKGVGDPLLYTREEMESALEAPIPEPSFTSPGWRRKLSWGTYLTAQDMMDVDGVKLSAAIRKSAKTPIPGSPMNPSQAIGWSLTGTMNSPSTNVAVMYSSENSNARESKPLPPKSLPTADPPSITPLSAKSTMKVDSSLSMPILPPFSSFDATTMPPPPAQQMNSMLTPEQVSDADLLLNLHSPFSASSPNNTRALPSSAAFIRGPAATMSNQTLPPQSDFSPGFTNYPTPSEYAYGDMVIDSQEVDMSTLGAEMMPWDLEYLPPPNMFYFGESGFEVGDLATTDDTGTGAPEG